MKEIDRRALTRGVLSGAAVVAAGLAAGPEIISAMPLDDGVPGDLDGSIENIQWGPPPRRGWRRRRVWRCWWHRGRRVCRWVWI
jgi:hypothetical protein